MTDTYRKAILKPPKTGQYTDFGRSLIYHVLLICGRYKKDIVEFLWKNDTKLRVDERNIEYIPSNTIFDNDPVCRGDLE